MDLRNSFRKFASLELSTLNLTTGAFARTGIFGALQVYDRFVSDRDFGQKKRLFLIPGELVIPRNQLILKVGGTPGLWMLEGVNCDADVSETYGSVAVLREARYPVSLYRQGGVKRASGTGYSSKVETLTHSTYGDFSRYSSSESREMDNTDYTIGTWYLPKGTPVDLDTVLGDSESRRFKVREVSVFLDLMMVRVQEIEEPTT